MMGRQINFYMSRDDQFAMDHQIRVKLPKILVFRHRMKERNFQFVQGTMDESLEAKTMFLALETQINDIFVDEQDSNGWYWVRSYKSPIVEYTRSSYTENDPRGKILRRGRIFFEPSYFNENGILVKKNEEFLKMANDFFNIFKKNLNYNRERGFYFGIGALKLESEGWLLPPNS